MVNLFWWSDFIRAITVEARICQPLLNILFAVSLAQTIQPNKTLSLRWFKRRMLNALPTLYFIAHFSQYLPKAGQRISLSDCFVQILPHQIAQRKFSLLFRLPFGVLLAAIGRLISGFDDRQTMLLADLIGYTPYIAIIVFECITIFFPIHKGNGIKHNMAVQVGFIQMRGNNRLIAAAQKTAGKPISRRYAASSVTSPGAKAWIRW